jgi:hypothetical protein
MHLHPNQKHQFKTYMWTESFACLWASKDLKITS